MDKISRIELLECLVRDLSCFDKNICNFVSRQKFTSAVEGISFIISDLKKGYTLNRGNSFRTHYVNVAHNSIPLVNCILNAKNINDVFNNSKTMLMFAAEMGYSNLSLRLLQYKANIHMVINGKNAMDYAYDNRNNELAWFLYEHGSTLNNTTRAETKCMLDKLDIIIHQSRCNIYRKPYSSGMFIL